MTFRAQRVLASLTVVLALVFVTPFMANAQSAEAGRFAVKQVVVVDIGDVLRKAEATQKVRAILDEKRNEFDAPVIWKQITMRDSPDQVFFFFMF